MIKNLIILLLLSSCTVKTVKVNNNDKPVANASEPNKQEKSINKIVNAVQSNNKSEFYFVEINNIPQPFDVAGNMPYVLWINGERVKNFPMNDLRELVSKVDNEVVPFKASHDIHAGWLTPHFVPHSKTQQDFPPMPMRLVKQK